MNLNTITRDGVTWELRAPGEAHYSTSREGGHLFLHAKRECSGMTDPATKLSWKIVETLWRKDAEASSTVNENDVSWCETCATRKVAGSG